MSIVLDSFFDPSPVGHGGNRRSAQIVELLTRSQIPFTRFERQLLTTGRDRVFAAIRALCNPKTVRFILKHQIELQPALKNLAFCGFQRQLYDQVLSQHTESNLLLWEATKNYVAPYVAKDRNFKVIAVPQNIEYFVPDAFPESLSTEIRALVSADFVFCISREEEWLLRLHGANAYYLPYYPPQEIEQQLLNIRARRTPGDRFLILGSASNPPTRQGIIEQIQWLKQIRPHLEFEVDIVGNKTESLKDYCDQTFTLHGTVSDEQLTALMTHAKTALIHQTASSGALTRIPELLMAGIPVIANGNACRSAFSYAGVYCYDDEFELLDLFTQSLNSPPSPPRPIAAEKRFIDAVQHLSQA
ncbi:MAG: hypothetical protein J0L70_22960 [Leptolyngbya sp. UWPOB_LEPTO1]|uniref:hypothetical protein n=1 Tax=Leptolyngbya sp. UWPOB_LEPTO1 TaxID=2815653 RepID=UPI001ACC717E|nr:hypothetical protein [Leptolyngbya sp. UWPOB_LEPTO1]MBN8563400.1 hypothetical protein [Leptolyngbya sp. UWPOB_LEPTO1]